MGTKARYKHVRTGAVQYIDQNLAASFPEWKPTTDVPPCKDDYTKDKYVPFEPESEATTTDSGESTTGFVRLNAPAEINADTSDEEAAETHAYTKRKKKGAYHG